MVALKRLVAGLVVAVLVAHGIWAEVRVRQVERDLARVAHAWGFLTTPVGKTDTGKVVVVGDVLTQLIEERILHDAAAFVAAQKGK